jgi:hypothetical protein
LALRHFIHSFSKQRLSHCSLSYSQLDSGSFTSEKVCTAEVVGIGSSYLMKWRLLGNFSILPSALTIQLNKPEYSNYLTRNFNLQAGWTAACGANKGGGRALFLTLQVRDNQYLSFFLSFMVCAGLCVS